MNEEKGPVMFEIDTGKLPARTVRDVLETVFRHKKMGLLFLLIVMLTTLAVLAFKPSQYTSTAKLIVRRGREGVFLDPVISSGNALPLHKEWESEINTELEILESRELLTEVAERLGDDLLSREEESAASGMLKPVRIVLGPARRLLVKFQKSLAGLSADPGEDRAPGGSSKAVEAIEDSLIVKSPEKSDIIMVSFSAASPKLARDVVAQLVDIYLDRRIDVHRVPGAHQFFGQQTEQLLHELKAAEDSISAIKNGTGVSSLEESRHVLQTSIGTIRTQQLQNKSALAAANARVVTLRAMLSRQDSGNPGAKTSALLDPTERLELQATLRSDEVAQAALLAEAGEYDRQLEQLRQELAEVNTLDAPIRKLEREQELLEEKYRKYYRDEEQARINEELETRKISNVSIVQNATVPSKADPSGKALKFFAAIFMGLFGAVGIAFGADYMDPALHSEADVAERLGQRTLLVLPRLRNGALSGYLRPDARKAGLKGRAASRNVDDYFQELLFKLLSGRERGAGGPFVIGVTGSVSGEGVSSLAANLAAACVHDDRFANTLLLDASREEHPEKRAGRMESAPFAYQHIRQGSDGVDPEDADGGIARFAGQLSQAKKQNYDVIVADLPPVSLGGCTLRMAEALDTVVVVVTAGSTPWRDALRTVGFLADSKSNLCGVILNRKILAMPQWLYQKL